MSGWSLHFDPPDMASWIWLAVVVLAAAEVIRYVLAGRRPSSVGGRCVVAAILVGVVAGGRAAGVARSIASGHASATLLLGALMVVWLARAYRQTTRNLGPWERRALLAIRVSAAMAVLVLLARPVLQHVSVSRERGALAILLDDSKSMRIRDVQNPSPSAGASGAQTEGKGGDASSAKARLEVVERTLNASEDALDGLAEDLDIRWFTFADTIREAPGPQMKGEGEQTALAGAVERVRELLAQSGGRRPAGVIVISDGRDNLSSDDERRAAGDWAAAASVPVYTVGVGSEMPLGPARSLAVRRLDCPPSVAVLNRLPVQAELLTAGLAGKKVTIELLFDDEIVDMREVQPERDQELVRTDLVYTPIAGGLHRVAIRARAADIRGPEGEASLSQFVRVTDDKVQVLYIDRPRYERATIARALEAAKELRVTKMELSPSAEGAASPLPHSAGEWRVYHVVLIGDVDRAAFPLAGLEALRDLAVEQGRGVAMLGGERTLGGGQYGGTPLAEVLPVDLSVVGQLESPVAYELTPAGQQHAICRMAGEAAAGAAIWKKLPPFDGAGRLAGVKPTAETLVRTPDAVPLLVVSETGKGRTAAVAFDSTWRWSFGSDKGVEAQRRFWRQLVLWLANRRPEVWVASDRPRYDLSRVRSGVDKVVLRAGVTDPTTGRPPEHAKVTGTMTGPDGKAREIRWLQTTDALEARPGITEAGEYHVSVSAASGEQKWGESQTAFIVAAADPELADSTADLENLRRLAARTRGFGGEYVPIEQFGKLLEHFAAKPHAAEVRRIRRCHLVDDWPWGWFVAFVGLLTVEWVARRRAGLV